MEAVAGDAPRPQPPRALCVSVHDVAPDTWPACAKLLSEIDAQGRIPVTLLIVPWYHRGRRIEEDAKFRYAIDGRLSRGDEVALHGYTHRDESPPPRHPLSYLIRRYYTAGEGEFHALSRPEAAHRIEKGLDAFRSVGWSTQGFIAPAWLLGADAQGALDTFDFSYTTTLTDFIALPHGHRERSRSLVYSVRKPWRLRASLMWNRLLFRHTAAQALLRLSLHPADAHCPQVLDQMRVLIARALLDRRPMTKSAWLSTASHLHRAN